MDSIFLSYRRDDTAEDAGHIYARLSERFGDEVVFLDVEDIELGEDFIDAIDNALRDAAYVLIAIGPRWLLLTDETGRRRLDDPDDMVRYEIRTALGGRKRVVPMLIGGAKMPGASTLPDDIAALVRRNGIEIRPAPDFDMDVDALMDGLKPDRIIASRVPTVFRVWRVARNLGFGGAIGWSASSLVFAMFLQKAENLLIMPFSGAVAGFSGGALTGWLTALLIRYKSPPLVGRKVLRMGINWSMMLILSAVIAGFIGYFLVFQDSQPPEFDTEGLNIFEAIMTAIVAALLTAIAMAMVLMVVIIFGFFAGTAVAAAFFARQFRMRSEEISTWRAIVIALVWMAGGIATAVLYVALIGWLT